MKLIFDNDAASDDIVALIYLASQPNITIEGITVTGTGEAHGPNGAQNIADLCYMLGKPNIPIAYGSGKPCNLSGKTFPDFLRAMMDDVFQNKQVPKNPKPNISEQAPELIKTILENSNEKITILITGPLTNIAELIIQYPHLKNKIEKLIIMGGAVDVRGNIQALDPKSDNQVAEWNIYADPKAAEIVFLSNIPITLVPLDATRQIPMTKEFYDALSEQRFPALHLIYQLLSDVVEQFGIAFFVQEFYLWDTLAAMILVNPSLALTESMPLQVDTTTAQIKRVSADTPNCSIIDVATTIPNAHLILMKLVNDIAVNLIAQNRLPMFDFFQKRNAALHKQHQILNATRLCT